MSGDLLAFLRARLQEDEHAAEVVHASDCAVHVSEWPEECNCGWPSRVLREVEAKRQIIKAYEEAVPFYEERPFASAGELEGLWTAIRHLAAVYSDHADYQAEWAP